MLAGRYGAWFDFQCAPKDPATMVNKNNGNPSDPWPEIAWHNAAQIPNRRMHNIYGLCQVVIPAGAGSLTAAQVHVGWVRAAFLLSFPFPFDPAR